MAKKIRSKKLEVTVFISLLFVALLIVLLIFYLSANKGPSFIVRNGNHLVIKNTNQRFRFLGGNHFNLLVKYLWGEFHGLTGNEVFEISAAHNITVIRFWATCSNGYWSDQCLYSGPNNWNNSKDNFFEKFDQLVEDAEEHGIYLIPVLSDAYQTFGSIGDGTEVGNQTEVCQVGSQANIEYKKFVKDVVTRYKDREIILMWEIGNEGHRYCSDYEGLLEWYEDTAAYIRQLDKNHLISTGEDNFGNLYKLQFKGVHSNENIGVTSVHIYDGDLPKITDVEYEPLIEYFISYWVAVAHDEVNKPIYFGEVGVYDVSANPQFYDDALKTAYNSDADGIIVWSWLEGAECDQPATNGGSCITPTRTPSITERISYWANKFKK